jgi:hypothetical protein
MVVAVADGEASVAVMARSTRAELGSDRVGC